MSRVLKLLLVLFGLTLLPERAEAQVCRTGKPCGNTCIARNRTCRVGPGTARAGGAAPSTPQVPLAVSTVVPEGAVFVGSTAGTTYYFVGCSAWRSLSAANLRWFRSREEAVAAGYRVSTQSGCQGSDAQVGALQGAPFAGAPPTPPAAEPDAACTVATVIDGDTLDCSDGRRIRLLLVDAPEMTQGAFGALAKTALEQLAPAGTALQVELDVELEDAYDRLLAYLALPDGRVVNEELLRQGVAVVSVYPPNVRHVERFRAAAGQAQQARAGLWALDAFACLPADHRAGRCPR